ncbi:hypothetical protein [Lactiplantibacillus modestisalitolerans]|uniref:Uncharacterized protein n=1 Tax=Lactiplantibacillus modestisalitolerans TaxID=1457219 RepID=A0ABV5WU50_9LACO|nr:hypothetical protein [Lactiplantibacillus modestisalitolerans]
MNLVIGPYLKHTQVAEPQPSMGKALARLDTCLDLIRQTGVAGLTDTASALGINLTYLLGNNVIVTNHNQQFTIIVDHQPRALTLTGCLIQDTFHNITHPYQPGYLISLNRQLVTTGEDLVELIDTQL